MSFSDEQAINRAFQRNDDAVADHETRIAALEEAVERLALRVSALSRDEHDARTKRDNSVAAIDASGSS